MRLFIALLIFVALLAAVNAAIEPDDMILIMPTVEVTDSGT